MMRWTGRSAIAAVMISMSAQAHAADWWLVAGEPGDTIAVFVDADSIKRADGELSFQTQTIARDGHAILSFQRLRCDEPVSPGEQEAVQRFACGTEEERMRSAMIIFPMTPQQTAQLIFAMPSAAEAGRDEARVAAR